MKSNGQNPMISQHFGDIHGPRFVHASPQVLLCIREEKCVDPRDGPGVKTWLQKMGDHRQT